MNLDLDKDAPIAVGLQLRAQLRDSGSTAQALEGDVARYQLMLARTLKVAMAEGLDLSAATRIFRFHHTKLSCSQRRMLRPCFVQIKTKRQTRMKTRISRKVGLNFIG